MMKTDINKKTLEAYQEFKNILLSSNTEVSNGKITLGSTGFIIAEEWCWILQENKPINIV